MRVLRGRADTVDADRAVTAALVAGVAETREPGLRVWYPHPQVAFGRRDVAAEGYDRARASAAGRGYAPVERSVGGRAVAFTGDVLAVVHAERADASEPGIDARYERTAAALERALADLGCDVRRGEPPDSFCPGTHSLQADGKVAGLAQRVRRDVAVVAGAVVVRDPGAVVDVLEPVYAALDVPFDPASVGSVAPATEDDPDDAAVRETVEAALVGDHSPTVRTVGDGARSVRDT